ncbi:hypothetical protein [Citrobacter braakii]|uniref:hypothetical protein n=1 Tax=Citrobacter braakii TaxID=57706 RepID=UPI001CC51F12|nr:hypothetical protein [Citrobacter braakii]
MTPRSYRMTLLAVITLTLVIAVCSMGIGRYGLSPWRVVQILSEPLSGRYPTIRLL